MIHAIADVPKVVALMPLYAHGDTDDKPSPVPKISKISDSAAAAIAPAKIAAQHTGLVKPALASDSSTDCVLL